MSISANAASIPLVWSNLNRLMALPCGFTPILPASISGLPLACPSDASITPALDANSSTTTEPFLANSLHWYVPCKYPAFSGLPHPSGYLLSLVLKSGVPMFSAYGLSVSGVSSSRYTRLESWEAITSVPCSALSTKLYVGFVLA